MKTMFLFGEDDRGVEWLSLDESDECYTHFSRSTSIVNSNNKSLYLKTLINFQKNGFLGYCSCNDHRFDI